MGTSFLRFLELADALQISVTVVTDNDGDVNALENKYLQYLGDNQKPNIKICYDKTVDTGSLTIGKKPYNYNTLEPKMIKANNGNLALFNKLFGTTYVGVKSNKKFNALGNCKRSDFRLK